MRGFAVSGAVLASASAMFAQAVMLHCLPPEPPIAALPDTALVEYRSEIAAEFEAYFSAVTDYIACLDDERSRTMDEARATTEAYSTLLNTIPVAKDRP